MGGSVRDGRDVVWGLKFLDEVARTYGLPAGESDMVDPEEAHASEAIRIGAILFVCALAAAPQYDVIKEGAATLMLGVDGPSVPFGFRMVRTVWCVSLWCAVVCVGLANKALCMFGSSRLDGAF